MPRLPRVTARQVLAALRRAGWYAVRQRGSHIRLAHPEHPNRITLALHAGQVVKPKTLRGILDDTHLTDEQFTDLL